MLWWPSSFFFKRWIVCFVAIVPFMDFAWGQVTLLVYINFFQACWTCHITPFDNNWFNRLQIINDAALMLASYFMFIFIGVGGPDPNVAYEASLWFNNLIWFTISINLLFAIIRGYFDWRQQLKLGEAKAAKILEREQRVLLYNGRKTERDEILQ